METENQKYKLPIAIGLIVCSAIPVLLLTVVEHIDIRSSTWSYSQKVLPFIGWTFEKYYLFGLSLPAITIAASIWFIVRKTVTVTEIAWVIVALIILHALWLSYGVLAFYVTNQSFILH